MQFWRSTGKKTLVYKESDDLLQDVRCETKNLSRYRAERTRPQWTEAKHFVFPKTLRFLKSTFDLHA